MDPYDEFPYEGLPIEWSAPERLSLASLLHGGPRPRREGYRVLELGCGNGSNLLPLAYYRRHATFVGLDRARGRIDLAKERAASLGLDNIEFIPADLQQALTAVEGTFDFIIAHGVLSWVEPETRDEMLALCAAKLLPQGLLYFNYNAKPGWVVRGMVRDFLLAHVAGIERIEDRVEAARAVASTLAPPLQEGDHPYAQLMANEFDFVCQSNPSLVAHDFLAPHNHAYWHGEMAQLLAAHGLAEVGDADFNYPWIHGDDKATPWLEEQGIEGSSLANTSDLIRYRQLRSPIWTPTPWEPRPLEPAEFDRLWIASKLAPDADDPAHNFVHPSGYEVEVTEDALCDVLRDLRTRWPRGRAIAEAFDDASPLMDDLLLLQRSGMLDLRYEGDALEGLDGEALHHHETQWGHYRTSPHHSVVMASR